MSDRYEVRSSGGGHIITLCGEWPPKSIMETEERTTVRFAHPLDARLLCQALNREWAIECADLEEKLNEERDCLEAVNVDETIRALVAEAL